MRFYRTSSIQRILFETDCFAWRDFVKVDSNCPTTGKELEVLFTTIYPNGGTFCKFKPLEKFYIDVWHIYNIMKAPGRISNTRLDEMTKIFNGEHLQDDPLRIERNFIYKLLVWSKYDIPYPYDKIPYSKSECLLKEKAHPVNYKGDIDFETYEGSFQFYPLWHKILYITLNIFNKELYLEWK